MKVYSSQGAVRSTIITYLDTRTIEIYLRFVRVTSLRKFHMRSYRSTLFFKFLDSFNRLVLAEVFVFVSSSLTKLMNCCLVLFFLSLSKMTAVLLSTQTWSHLHRSCDRATGQDDIRRCSVWLTGIWDFHILKASIVSDLSESATGIA